MKKLLLLFLVFTSLIFGKDFEITQKTFYLTDNSRKEQYSTNLNKEEKVRISYTIYYQKNSNKKNHPLVIYNHGFGGSIEEGGIFFSELVKRGYIVMSLTHKYLSGVFLEEDGKIVDQGPRSWTDAALALYPNILQKDTLLALEHFKSVNSNQLDNLVDTSFYIATGWSIGGAIAGILLNEDQNCIGAINFDGNNLNMKPTYKYNKPFLMYLSTQFPWDERADSFKIKEINPNNVNYLIYQNTVHMDFKGINPTKKEFSSSVLSSSIDFISLVFKTEPYKENLAKLDNNETIFFDRIPEPKKNNLVIITLSILGICVLGFGIKKFKK